MSAELIETGSGWMHVTAHIFGIDPHTYLIGQVRAVVDARQLAQFANGTQEVTFVTQNRISTLAPAIYTADPSGYNSGNLLIGMTYAVP